MRSALLLSGSGPVVFLSASPLPAPSSILLFDLACATLHVSLAPGHSANAGRTLTQVCSGWRRGLGEERSALQQLRFNQLELQQGGSSSDSGGGSSGSRSARLPWLVERSVRAGNVAATVAAARWTERCQLQQHGRTGPQLSARAAAAAARAAGTWYGGCEAAASAVAAAAAGGAASSEGAADAARYWKKAAKLGHPEAQWKLGWGHYKVRCNQALLPLPHYC